MATSDQSWSFPESPSFPAVGADADVETMVCTADARSTRESGCPAPLGQGVTFSPLVRQVHRWSDRLKTVDLPLFGCYVFAKLPPRDDERLRVLLVDGVMKFVGTSRTGNSDSRRTDRCDSHAGG